MAEAVTLAERYEVEPAKLMQLITGTLFSAPVYSTYGALIIKGEFTPAAFKLALGLKDLRLALGRRRNGRRADAVRQHRARQSCRLPSATATPTRISRRWPWWRAGGPALTATAQANPD